MIRLRSLLILLIALVAVIITASVTISRAGAAPSATFPATARAVAGGALLTVDPPPGTALICVIIATPASVPPCSPPAGPLFIAGAAPGAGVAVYAFDADLSPTAEAHLAVPWAVYLPGVTR